MTFIARPWLALALVLMCSAASPIAAGVPAKPVLPMKQGSHEWSLPSGKLFLIIGSYQDVINFHRTYNFYFVANNNTDWHQVSIVRKAGEVASSMASASGGDITLRDGLAVKQGNSFYFIVADKRADKGWAEKGDITATWFKFIESDDADPEGPAYVLKPVFSRTYSKSSDPNVEEVLGKEFLLKPSK